MNQRARRRHPVGGLPLAGAIVVIAGATLGGLAMLLPLSVWSVSLHSAGPARANNFIAPVEALLFGLLLLSAAIPAVLAIVSGRPQLTLIAALPGIVVTGFMAWYVLDRLPAMDALLPDDEVRAGPCAWGLLAGGLIIVAGAALVFLAPARPPAR
jgi:hypothetical protein